MNDREETGSDDAGRPPRSRTRGIKFLVLVFVLPLALVLLAEWLAF
jgi:hypothetical protein